MRGREARRRHEDALATGVVVGVTALTAIGGRINSDYDSAWFRALRKPCWEPPGAVIGAVWAVLYLCTALSASLLWRKRATHDARTLMGLFALQYLLNYAFTPLLTLRRSLSLSTVDSGALHLVVDAIIALA